MPKKKCLQTHPCGKRNVVDRREKMQRAPPSMHETACRHANAEFKWAHLKTNATLAMNPTPSGPTRMAELAVPAGAGADAESGAGAGADVLADAGAGADAEKAGTGCHVRSESFVWLPYPKLIHAPPDLG